VCECLLGALFTFTTKSALNRERGEHRSVSPCGGGFELVGSCISTHAPTHHSRCARWLSPLRCRPQRTCNCPSPACAPAAESARCAPCPCHQRARGDAANQQHRRPAVSYATIKTHKHKSPQALSASPIRLLSLINWPSSVTIWQE
jgi:hypothetical protein